MLDGYIQNGGVFHGVDLDDDEYQAGLAGFEWLGLAEPAAVLRLVFEVDRSGRSEGLSDEELEEQAADWEGRYAQVEKDLQPAFEARWEAEPGAFAPVTAEDRAWYVEDQKWLGRLMGERD